MKRKAVFIGIFVIFLVALYFDFDIVKFVSLVRINFLNDFFLGFAFISSELIIFGFLTILFLLRKNTRKDIFPLWTAILFSGLVSFLLKISVQRARPFQAGLISLLPTMEEVSHSFWNFSFPSSHAMIAFCTIPFLSKEFPKFKYVWIGFASLIALSRIYLGVHFLSDVIAGSVIGYLIGFGILKFEKENKFFEKIWNRIFKK